MFNRQATKYLIIGPAWVGDMVMAQVLFKLLKQAEPDCTIDVAAAEWTIPLVARMPEVQTAIALPFKHGELALRKRYQIGRALRAKQYDQAIIMQISLKSALVPFFAKIAKRTGAISEFRYGIINDRRKLNRQRYPLMIQYYAQMAFPNGSELPAVLPWPKLIISKQNREESIKRHQAVVDQRPILALCPGAEYGPAKRWPAEYFAEVARHKLAEGWQVWLFGSKKDELLADIIQEQSGGRCFNLTGKTALLDAVDLLSLATAVVSNDSGLMHVASALEKPLVVIYGSSSPQYTPPLNHHVNIQSLNLACSPCFKRTCPLTHLNCLKQLLPTQIIQALNELTANISMVTDGALA